MEMTPIRNLRVQGNEVFTVDFAGTDHLVATCPDPEGASWVAWSLGRAHSRDVDYGKADGALSLTPNR